MKVPFFYLPFLMWHHFARSLEYNENYSYRFLEYAFAHSTHIQDLHITHFEPSDGKDGACRYCPPTNHIGQDNLSPSVMNQTSHHKTQSMFFKYYLSGEDRALDVALKGVKWIKGFGTGTASNFEITCYSRRLGHIMNTLIMGYKHNFDGTCLTRLNADLAALRTTIGSGGVNMCNTGGNTIDQRWMVGLLTEPLVDAYDITGNEQYAATAKQIIDNTSGGLGSNVAYSAAFSARHYNNLAYLSRAASLLSGVGNGVSFGHHEKDYALNCRSVLMSFYYFAIPDSVNKKLAVEAAAAPAGEVEAVAVYPNPFNPVITLQVQGKMKNAKCKMQIYNSQGKLVHSAQGMNTGEYVWNAKGLPSGVYYLKAEIDGKRVARRMVYLR